MPLGATSSGAIAASQAGCSLIDNELFPVTIANRLERVASARGIILSDVQDRICVLPLRGKLRDIHGIQGILDKYKAGNFDLIVIDAFYRALPSGTDENDNGAMGLLMNTIDAMAIRMGAGIVLICHSPKGDVSGREVVDLVAGAGAMTRAIDAVLGIRRHEVDGCFTVSSRVRNFREPDELVIEKQYPIFTPRPDLDPAKLYRPAKAKAGRARDTALQVKSDIEGRTGEALDP